MASPGDVVRFDAAAGHAVVWAVRGVAQGGIGRSAVAADGEGLSPESTRAVSCNALDNYVIVDRPRRIRRTKPSRVTPRSLPFRGMRGCHEFCFLEFCFLDEVSTRKGSVHRHGQRMLDGLPVCVCRDVLRGKTRLVLPRMPDRDRCWLDRLVSRWADVCAFCLGGNAAGLRFSGV
jgi:hypothetical protein